MRRPWELGHMERRAPHRVYVPITLPDSSSSTFAVLELVGFSHSSPPSSSSSSHSFISPSLSSLSPLQQLDESFICHSQQQPLPLPVSLPLNLPLVTSLDAPNSASNDDTLHLPHTETSVKIPQISEVVASAAPAPTASPFLGKKISATPGASPLIVAQKAGAVIEGRVHVVQTQIKENVVHTTSFNFKDVVQKLTGASWNDKDMMPVTLLNRPAAMPIGSKPSASKAMDALSVKGNASRGLKRAPSRLHERRKALHNLKQLCTDKYLAVSASSCISPPAQSPVTPLASYFDKFCNANTPTASQSSRSSGVSSPRPPFHELDSLNAPIIAPYIGASIAEHLAQSPCNRGAHALSKAKECASDLLQTLGGPSLLSLFPESPICSPTDL